MDQPSAYELQQDVAPLSQRSIGADMPDTAYHATPVQPRDDIPHSDTLPSAFPEPPAKQRGKWRSTAILVALLLSLFVSALDATIVATAASVITHDLKSANGYVWIGGAYLLADSVSGPVWAKVSDIVGRKIVLLTAIAIFFVSSIICATARTMQTLITGRAIQGSGGGAIFLLVHISISDMFSMRRRSFFMGLCEFVWALAGGVGPILGGVFASLVSWRFCFWINLPIAGTAFILLLFCFDLKHEKTSWSTGLKAIDWCGIFTFLGFAVLILLGLNFGPILSWDSPTVIAMVTIGGAFIFAFAYSESRLAKYPIIPLGLFKSRTTGGLISGVIISTTGQFLELIWVGSIILCAGAGSFISFNENTSTSPPIIAIQTSVSQQDIASAISTFSFTRCVALAVSIIIGGVVFNESMQKQHDSLESAGLPADILERLSGKEAAANIDLSKQLTDSMQVLAVKNAFAWSLNHMFIMYTCVAGCALVSGLFVRRAHLKKEHVETVTGIKEG
ncbi:MFS transporter-like protein [Penicillium mononematosum]|uniref:MFS transporter-like protein n=1 Tax=Penicillium mononematosum TaxID=268346 RepID=UPI002546D058|nr:MFS transporter-like protein [Penicillium mononematosum]KAJ6186508.1 MFS transporter-like protein [Penicillium mononematosum]